MASADSFQHPQGIVAHHPFFRIPDDLLLNIPEASEGVYYPVPFYIIGDGINSEIPPGQVILDRALIQAYVQGCIPYDDPVGLNRLFRE